MLSCTWLEGILQGITRARLDSSYLVPELAKHRTCMYHSTLAHWSILLFYTSHEYHVSLILIYLHA